MKYSYSQSDGIESIAALIDGELYQATSGHPGWSVIKEKCFNGTLEVKDFDLEQQVIDHFKITDTVSIINGEVYFDGDIAHGLLADRIIKSASEGSDPTPLANFMWKLSNNPSRNSRDQLFWWLEKSGFEIAQNGDVIGYKSVHSQSEPNKFLSVSSGEAFVNGTKHVGQIPQTFGDFVSMPRSEVTDNPSVACSYGLHVGTLDYAKGFSGDTVLVVHVNPANVVSVPMDSGCEKMRVCEYEVMWVLADTNYYEFQNSSWLKSAAWNDGVLTVTMKSGSAYQYKDVTEDVFGAWLDADEYGYPGEFYNDEIKGEYERV